MSTVLILYFGVLCLRHTAMTSPYYVAGASGLYLLPGKGAFGCDTQQSFYQTKLSHLEPDSLLHAV